LGEIEEAVEKFYPKLVEILQKKAPELAPKYHDAYLKASNPATPLAIRYYYAAEILKAYINLSEGD